MPLVSWTNLDCHRGAQTVFVGASGAVEPGEKVALVGPNGSGKTTLLRILAEAGAGAAGANAGASASGAVALRRGATVGYLPQRPEPPPHKTLRQWVMEAFAPIERIERELEKVHEGLATARGEALERLLARQAELQHELERRGGWDATRRAEAVLMGLGFRPEDLEKEARLLSGGEKARGALARLLCEEPDLLLLDEPTNHLDLEMLEWLEGWLRAAREAAIIASHDRYFLDRVVTKVFAIERGRTIEYGGNYTAYAAERDARAIRAAKERAQHEAFVEKERAFIRRFRAGQRAREAAGREKKLARLIAEFEVQAAAGPVPAGGVRGAGGGGRAVAFSFGEVRRSGDEVLRAKGLAHAFGGRTLFQGLDLALRRGDRVGIVGPNGSGKTTLLRILAGEVAPARGEVRIGAGVEIGYYRQEGEDLDPERTALEEAHGAAPREDLERVRAALGRFGLSDDEQLKKVGALSGGERARVVLARLFLRRPNLLLLDEPTNHLDLPAREALEAALGEFSGTILAVSHDRYFLDRIATKILAFGEGRGAPRLFYGDYTAYRERREAEAHEAREAREREGRERDGREGRRERAAAGAKPEAQRAGAPRVRKRHTYEELERKIIEREERAKAIEAALADPANARDHAKLAGLAEELAAVRAELAELEAEWELWA